MSSQTNLRSSVAIYAFVVIGAISGSMLMYQILLTRVSALRLFFHFGFLAVSNCLLGIGAAGTMITVLQRQWSSDPRRHVWHFCLLYLASLVIAYTFALTVEIPVDLDLTTLDHFLRFSAFNLMVALPFFFSGAVVGMILTFHAHGVNRLYFTDLVGAGLGCLACPFILSAFGAGGCLVFVALAARVFFSRPQAATA